MMNRFVQGKYTPSNPKKYKGGDVNNIRYLSMWERNVMVWLDHEPSIIHWNSEEIVIPYLDYSTLDSMGEPKPRKYMIDFWCRVNTINGLKMFLIEVKPKNQVEKPKKTSRTKEETYQAKMKTWIKNKSKWMAAEAFAEKMNMSFKILTEEQIFAGIDKGYKRKRKKLAKSNKV